MVEENTRYNVVFSGLIYVTFVVKISFLVSALYLRYLKKTDPKNIELQTFVQNAKEQLDFVFVFCMSVILMALFNPYVEHVEVDKECQILLFLYGVIMILTANYDIFLDHSVVLHDLSNNSLFNPNNVQTYNYH